jgi:hypothetical protein
MYEAAALYGSYWTVGMKSLMLFAPAMGMDPHADGNWVEAACMRTRRGQPAFGGAGTGAS